MRNTIEKMSVWYHDGVVFEINSKKMCSKDMITISELNEDGVLKENKIPICMDSDLIVQVTDLIRACDRLHFSSYHSKAKKTYIFLQTKKNHGRFITFAKINLNNELLDTHNEWTMTSHEHGKVTKSRVTDEIVNIAVNHFA